MSTVLDNPSLFLSPNSDITFKTWFARYSGSQGYSTLLDPAPTYTPDAQFSAVNTTSNLKTGFNTYYKMQGFNKATGQYEVWHSMNTPQILPPSGDPLVNVQVISTWIDR
jgi:hypothetical protein